MSVFQDWDVQTCDVRTGVSYDDAGGPSTAVEHLGVPCQIDSGSQLVRSSAGDETVSSMRIHLELKYAEWFPLNSTVTALGVEAEVIDRIVFDDGDPDLDGVTVVLK